MAPMRLNFSQRPTLGAYVTKIVFSARCLCYDVSVRLSVLEHISKITRTNITEVSVHVTCGRGSVLDWRRCNMFLIIGPMALQAMQVG